MPVKKKKIVKKESSGEALGLPTTKKTVEEDIGIYVGLIYGREKIGKTTILSTFPECMFLSTEPGTKGLEIFEFNAEDGGTRTWELFRQAVDLLEQNPGQFKTIIIDTVDRAYDMCMDWVCQKRGIEYPGSNADGSADYGKSWKAVREEFTTQVHRIIQSGRGVWFTSHSKEMQVESRSGQKYDRIVPSMSGQARGVVEPLVDFALYAEHFQDRKGDARRVLICEGDETVWAGVRATPAGEFPQFLPMDRIDGYTVIRDAFTGKTKGISAKDLLPAKNTGGASAKVLGKARRAGD